MPNTKQDKHNIRDTNWQSSLNVETSVVMIVLSIKFEGLYYRYGVDTLHKLSSVRGSNELSDVFCSDY